MGSTASADFTVEARRLAGEEPVMTAEHFARAGAAEKEAANINGPSVVRVPEWVPGAERPDPDAAYYMYFAHHGGRYIRMAYAPKPVGPWKLFNTGEATDSTIGDLAGGIPPRRTPGSGVLDMGLGKDGELHTGRFRIHGHVASPDVRVDEVNRRFVMYFHAPSEPRRQETFVATSRFGLNFNDPANGGESFDDHRSGIRDVIPGWFYFRTFEIDERTFAYANGGKLYRAPAETAEGEPATLSNADAPGGLWRPREEDDPSAYWEIIDDEHNPIRRIYRDQGRDVTDSRHFAVLHDPDISPDHIFVLYSAKHDKPESILLTLLEIPPRGVPDRTDPANWKIVPPAQRTILAPEADWEGGDLPVTRSRSGSATGVRELRDPFVLKDRDGRLYLYYSGRGEEAIGVAELRIRNGRGR